METILYFRPSPSSKREKLDGVMEIAQKAHIHVQVIDTNPVPARIRSLLAFWKCRGAIIECGGRKHPIDESAFGETPVVFFNRGFKTLLRRHFAVHHDSQNTGMLAARELLLTVADHFAYIPAPDNPLWSHERQHGFQSALALNGKQCRDFAWAKPFREPTARIRQLQKFLKQIPKPCAIFAANDILAAEVITAARMSEIPVPDAISVLGVDNATDICEHTQPSLSSIEPDFRRGGNLAMLMLLSIMRNEDTFHGDRQQTFGDLRVVRRLSTKKLFREDPVVTQALNLIHQKSCEGLTAAEVARLFPCSRRMADLRFTQAVGHTILNEIHAVRMERAQQLLRNPNQIIKTIAYFCGFKHPNSLRKFFRKETGLTLSAWRKQHLSAH